MSGCEREVGWRVDGVSGYERDGDEGGSIVSKDGRG